MRLCLLVPAEPWRPTTLSVVAAAGVDELEEEGTVVLDLGLADVRLADGVAPACELLELWGLNLVELLTLRSRLVASAASRTPLGGSRGV